MESLLRFLLTESAVPAPLSDVLEACARHAGQPFTTPVDVATAGGFVSDRLGYAFVAGYQAAVHALVPERAAGRRVALCATEDGGGHPSAIRTRLVQGDDGWTLSGTKAFVTLGTRAEGLVVVASEGVTESGRNRLRAVVVDADRRGITMQDGPPTPFAPEIPHARLTLTDVAVVAEEIVRGDGYLGVLKPFRTIEDIHVLASALGWLVQVARRSDWPTAIVEKALSAVAALRHLAGEDPSSPATHVALGGVVTAVDALLASAESRWPDTDPSTRERWERDRALLRVAGTARAKRLEAAWRSLRA